MNKQAIITKTNELDYYIPTEILIPEENGTYNLSVVVKDGEISYTLDSSSSSSGLPEVTNDDNGDVLTVIDGEWANATPSGGSTEILVATFTGYPVPLGSGITCDKTYAELLSAIESGKIVIGLFGDGQFFLNKVIGGIGGNRMTTIHDGSIVAESLIIANDESVSWEDGSIPVVGEN